MKRRVSLGKRALAVALAFAMTANGVPAPAIAQALGDAVPQEQSVETQAQTQAQAAADQVTAGADEQQPADQRATDQQSADQRAETEAEAKAAEEQAAAEKAAAEQAEAEKRAAEEQAQAAAEKAEAEKAEAEKRAAEEAKAKAAEEAKAKAAEERAAAEKAAHPLDATPEGVDPATADGLDFSSARLLVLGLKAGDFTPDTQVLGDYDGLFLTQYADAEHARNAFLYYKFVKRAELVEPDVAVSAAEDANEDNETNEAPAGSVAARPMGEGANPLAELAGAKAAGELAAAAEASAGTYTVALVDTGYTGEGLVAATSVLGDATADDNGHGTRMAEFIRAADKDARILSIKALDATGTGTTASVYAAIKYAVEAKADAIDLSLSAWATEENAVVREAIDEATNAGVVVVGAAGNRGVDARRTVPGGVESALVAGAADGTGARLSTSNWGDTVDAYVTAGSTSEAAARMAGWLSANGLRAADWQARLAEAIADGTFSDGAAREAAGPAVPEEDPSDAGFHAADSWVKNIKRGRYEIRNHDSLKDLNVAANEYASGTNVHVWDYGVGDGHFGQRWIIMPYQTYQDTYVIHCATQPYHLDVYGNENDLSHGYNVMIWGDHSGDYVSSTESFAFMDSAVYNDFNGVRYYCYRIGLRTSKTGGTGANNLSYILRSDGNANGNNVYVSSWSTSTATAGTYWFLIPSKYTVKYDANGGTGTIGNQDIQLDSADTLSNGSGFSRTGYTFAGWATSASGSVVRSGGAKANGNSLSDNLGAEGKTVTLYAKWTKNNYTLDLNGTLVDGSGNTSSVGNINGYATASVTVGGSSKGTNLTDYCTDHPYDTAYEIVATATEGHTITGASGGSSTNTVTGATSTKASTGKIAGKIGTSRTDARFTIKTNKYTVNFNGNGNTGGTMNSQTMVYATSTKLTANSFTRTGYSFAGWNTKADGKGTSYTNQQSVSQLAGKWLDGESITLYAQWTPNYYTLTLNANNASGCADGTGKVYERYNNAIYRDYNSGTNAYSAAMTTSANAITKPAHNWTVTYDTSAKDGLETDMATTAANTTAAATFEGYYNSAEGTTQYINKDGYVNADNFKNNTFSSNQTLCAHWGAGGAVTLPEPTMPHYTFKGWYTGPDGSGTKAGDAGAAYTPSDNVKLYAKWEKTYFNVRFDANGGSGSFAKSMAWHEDASITGQSAPTRSGYVFSGFYDAKTGGNLVYDSGLNYQLTDPDTFHGEAATTYYAHWAPATYYVQYMGWDDELKDDVVVEVLDATGNPTPADAEHEVPAGCDPMTFGEYTLKGPEELGLKRSHHNFVGWNIYPSQDWRMYDAGKAYKGGLAQKQNDVVVLYAAWAPMDQYTITYDAQGGINKPPSEEAYKGEPYVIPSGASSIPKYENKEFLGWNTAADGTGTWYYPGQGPRDIAKAPAGVENYGYGPYFVEDADKITLNNQIESVTRNTVLYAIWADDPKLSYNMNGGIGFIQPTYIKPYTNAAVDFRAESLPTRTGYTFAGWSTVATPGEGDVVYAKGGIEQIADFHENTTLYAQWEVQHIDLDVGTMEKSDVDVYLWNSESGQIGAKVDDATWVPYGQPYWFAVHLPKKYDGSSMRVTVNDSTTRLQGTKAGDDEDVYYLYKVNTPIEEQVVSASQIDERTYRVGLAPQGGTIDEGQDVTSYVYSVGVTLPTAEHVTRPGYTFKGWYESEEPTAEDQPIAAVTGTDKGDKAFFAQWEPISFKLRYHSIGTHTFKASVDAGASADGLTFVDKGDSKTYGESARLLNAVNEDMFGNGTVVGTESGNFVGWATSAADQLAGTITYTDGQRISGVMPTRDESDGNYYVDLYAVWVADYAWLTYDVNGGSPSLGAVLMDKGASLELPAQGTDVGQVHRDGYMLDGWLSSSDGTTYGDTILASPFTLESDTWLKAKWTPGQYSVAFHRAGGDGQDPNPATREMTVDETYTLPIATSGDGEGFLGYTPPNYNLESFSWTRRDGFPESAADTRNAGDCVALREIVADTASDEEKEHLNGTEGVTSHVAKVITTGTPIYKYNVEKVESTDGEGAGTTVTYNLTTNYYWVEDGLGTSHLEASPVTDGDNDHYFAKGENVTITLDGNPLTEEQAVAITQNLVTYEVNTVYEWSKTYDTAPKVFLGWATSEARASAGEVTYLNLAYTKSLEVTNLTKTIGGTVDLYAVWADREYHYVTYDSNGGGWGKGGQASASVIGDDFKVELTQTLPLRTGYTFDGWAKRTGEGTEQSPYTYEKVTGDTTYAVGEGDGRTAVDTTLYAQWKPNTYRVVFNGDAYEADGSLVEDPASVYQEMTYDADGRLAAYDASADFWKSFKSAGHVKSVKGWTTVKPAAGLEPGSSDTRDISLQDGQAVLNLSTEAYGSTTTGEGDEQVTTTTGVVNLYPVWNYDYVTLTYDTNGGSSVAARTELGGTKVTLPTPVRDGYKLLGWVAGTQQEGQTELPQQNSYAAGAEYTLESDVTLYAWWVKSVTGHVRYQWTDGEGEGAKVTRYLLDLNTYTEGDKFNVVIDTSITRRTGYVFKDWKLGDKTYGAPTELDFKPEGESTDITFEAEWTPITYNVAYSLNNDDARVEGDLPTATLTYDNDQDVLWNPAKDASPRVTQPTGVHFAGWALQASSAVADLAADAQGRIDAPNLSETANDTVTLYAVWLPDSGKLAFESGTESALAEKDVTTGDPWPELTNAYKPTRQGYVFEGWYDKAQGEDGATQVYDADLVCQMAGALEVDQDETIRLYAHWSEATYTVVYRDLTGAELMRQTPRINTPYTLLHHDDPSVGITISASQRFRWIIGSLANMSAPTYVLEPTKDDQIEDGIWLDNTAAKQGDVIELWANVVDNQVFTVTYDANGGVYTNGNTPADDSVVESELAVVQFDTVPSLKGYKFCGWSLTNKVDGQVVRKKFYATQEIYDAHASDPDRADPINAEGEPYKAGWLINDNSTLHAIWEEAKYGITYHGNGGTTNGQEPGADNQTVSSSDILYTAEHPLAAANTFTRKGYTFLGWGVDSNTKRYNAGERVSGLAEDGQTKDLYAIWAVAEPEDKTLYLAEVADQTFTGSVIEPRPTVRLTNASGDILVLNRDYLLSYDNNVNVTPDGATDAQKATVTATGIGTYAGFSGSAKFTIKPAPEKVFTVGEVASQDYTGEAVEPRPEVTVDEGGVVKTLSFGTDYLLAYDNNVSPSSDSSKATVFVTGIGAYAGYSGTRQFTIKPAPHKVFSLDTVADQIHTGSAIEPRPTVKVTVGDGERVLGYNRDYLLSYENNVDVSTEGKTATVYAVGINDYAGYSGSTTFKITEAPSTVLTVVSPDDQTYTGAEIKPQPKVTDASGTELVFGTHYMLVYDNNVEVSTESKKATVYAVGINDYAGHNGSAQFSIKPAPEKTFAVGAVEDQVYTGAPINPQPEVKVGEAVLAFGRDYFLTYDNNVNVGTATIYVTGTGDYNGYSGSTTFAITAAPKKEFVTGAVGVQTYTGSEVTPRPEVRDGNNVLKLNRDYVLAYDNNVEAGEGALIYVTGIGSYSGYSATVGFAIEKLEVADAKVSVTAPADQAYIGSGLTPRPTVTFDGKPLAEGTDYTLEYKNNVNAGTATVVVSGAGNFTGERSVTFNIAKRDVAKDTAIAEPGDQTYTGSGLTPKPTVTFDGKPLVEGTDYTLSYKNNVNAGTATVTVAGKGNFAGSTPVTFRIMPFDADSAASVTRPVKVAPVADQTYTGKAFTPKPRVTWGSATLREGTDFTYSYKNNVNVGTATVTVTVTLKGNYKGSRSVTFRIKAAGDVSVSAPADQTYTGKAIQAKPTVKYNGTALREGTDYTLSWKDNVNVGTATVTVTLRGNYAGSKAAKFRIKAAGDVSVSAPADQTYTGRAIQAKPTVKFNGKALREGTDYTLSWKDNVNAGTATVTVTLRGNYAGSRSATFRINPAGADGGSGQAGSFRMDPVPDQTYTGHALTPKPTVRFNGTTLREGADYALSYANNVAVGTATVTANFKGNYSGSRSATFGIGDVVAMHRLYNPYTGEHFYTANESERDALVAAGWGYEGIGWYAPRSSSAPVYRLFNPYSGDHHYTTSAGERDSLLAAGWTDEGIGWHSDDARGVALLRQYNPYASVGGHNYTSSEGERDALVSAGWQDEGTGWYGVKMG